MENNVIPSFITEDVPAQSNILVELTELANAQIAQEQYVKELTESLDSAKKSLYRISMTEIPDLLRKHGLSRIKLANGMEVNIKEDINVTIVDEQRFFKYLEDNNSDDIIKSQISLGKQETGLLAELRTFMRDKGMEYDEKKGVHAQTMKKFFKVKCGIGLDDAERAYGYKTGKLTPPSSLPDWCKVFTVAKAQIKK